MTVRAIDGAVDHVARSRTAAPRRESRSHPPAPTSSQTRSRPNPGGARRRRQSAAAARSGPAKDLRHGIEMILGQRDDDLVDAIARGQRRDAQFENRAAADFEELLGPIGAEAHAPAACGDNGGDIHVGTRLYSEDGYEDAPDNAGDRAGAGRRRRPPLKTRRTASSRAPRLARTISARACGWSAASPSGRRCRSSARTLRRSVISAGTTACRSMSSADQTVTVSGAGHSLANGEVQRRSGLRDPAARRNRHSLQAGRGPAQPSRRGDTTLADRRCQRRSRTAERRRHRRARLGLRAEDTQHSRDRRRAPGQDRRRALRAGVDQGHAANQLVGGQEHHRGADRHHRATGRAQGRRGGADQGVARQRRSAPRDPGARPAAHEQRTRLRQSRPQRP